MESRGALRGTGSEVPFYKRYLAEFVGTFVLVLGGVGTAVLAGERVGVLGISLAFGLALLAMVYALGPISGAHLNPAVTLGLLIAGKFEGRHVAGYMAAQLVGAIAAAGLVLLAAMGGPEGYSAGIDGLAANGFGNRSPAGFGLGAAVLVEVLFTFVLVLTVIGATDTRAPLGFAGLAIGLALALTNLAAIPVDNASINPARSLGPALFVGGWALQQLWVFIVAPLAGGALAAAVFRAVRLPVPPLTAREAERALESESAQRLAKGRTESPA